ncbi:hypothetical protein ABW19_dt0203917 [Dactylella cylindrospora]|nr:hypothetical protein ABW19_dt0203917 [Dactylella cylindrospora]
MGKGKLLVQALLAKLAFREPLSMYAIPASILFFPFQLFFETSLSTTRWKTPLQTLFFPPKSSQRRTTQSLSFFLFPFYRVSVVRARIVEFGDAGCVFLCRAYKDNFSAYWPKESRDRVGRTCRI